MVEFSEGMDSWGREESSQNRMVMSSLSSLKVLCP